jgi:hypothetical protein
MPEKKEIPVVTLEEMVAALFSDVVAYKEHDFVDDVYFYPKLASGKVRNQTFDSRAEADYASQCRKIKSKRDSEQNPKRRKVWDLYCKIIDMFDYVIKNPYEQESIDFMNAFKMVAIASCAKRGGNARYIDDIINDIDVKNYMMLLMGKVDKFDNEELKYMFYKSFDVDGKGISEDVKNAALLRRSNSPLATVDDLFALLQNNKEDKEKARKIFTDLETLARQELEHEFSKDAPDLKKVNNICGKTIIASRLTEDLRISSQIEEIYDLNKILMGNPVEYISKMPNPYAEKIEALERQLTELQQQHAEAQQQSQQQITKLQQILSAKTNELQTLTNTFNSTKQTLEAARAQNQELNRQNSQLNQANETLIRTIETKDAKTRKLIEATKKVGLLGSGVNNLKKLVEEMEK